MQKWLAEEVDILLIVPEGIEISDEQDDGIDRFAF